jgi:hypothetical protein
MIVIVFSSFGEPNGAIVIDKPNPTMYDIKPAIDAHFTKAWNGHQGLTVNSAIQEFTVIVGGKAPYEAHFTYKILKSDAGGVTSWNE